ncbi:MarR family transcriptional regulator [Glutamicibacter sp.]|uniref:MarR family winged helix-turn-helix transcriptional regulator n=1 Tax=Glutamicibacter sp. TaxID=1931995 RepID=UPI0028BE141A|nr:MarR family transcriptional regulator [Glutamicibacter sp.]
MHDDQLMQSVEEEFTALLLRARQMLIRRAKIIHPDLQDPGYRLLAVVIREEGQQQGALAERLRLDKATISRLVQHLESLNLVSRTPDPRDGRAQLVSATDEAREKWRSSGNTLRQELRHHLSEWEESELKDFSQLLHRLNHSFEEIL